MSQKNKIKLAFLGIVVLVIASASLILPRNFSFKLFKWQVNIAATEDKAAPLFKKDGNNFNISLLNRYHLGLDLQGGTHLIYEADLGGIDSGKQAEAMEGVRDVIERRVNLFGVAEPLVQIEGKNRLVVDLAGVKDIDQAIKMIGETPALEFREEISRDQYAAAYKQQLGKDLPADAQGPFFVPAGLTGKDLVRGEMDYSQDRALSEPIVKLEFNEEGKKKFAEITTRLAVPNCVQSGGKRIAIYLDGVSITSPCVNEAITDGSAIISGSFTADEAKTLAKRLNAGALPVPIKLISQQTIGATLGQDSLFKSLKAGLYGFILIALFMVLYYRLPGFLASVALIAYIILVLALFNLIGITLTLSGIAGLILTLGMAVDANVLIFERMREELLGGKSLNLAVQDGFNRAWPSIWDSNLTTLVTAFALFWFGSGLIKGFAVALSIGIIISMFSAIVITKNFLLLALNSRIAKYKQLF